MLTSARTAGWVLALALCHPTQAAADEVDRLVEVRIRSLRLPGLSLAVVREGRIAKAAGYGLADIELNAPARADTVYELGSVTKQFTAAAIMKLAEQQRLRLDDPISTYLDDTPAAWSRITVQHLLGHTSGIQNHVAVPAFMQVFKTDLLMNVSPARDELLGMFYRLPLEFEAGETWAYDNTGYYLLGLIVERVTGTSYWEFLQQVIFGPLGMAATRPTVPRAVVPNRASGYEWVDGRFENRPALPDAVAFSAGGLLSTVEDMARWDGALRRGALLSDSSTRQIWTAATARNGTLLPMEYGFGWFTADRCGHRVVQHSGGTPGFSSTIYRFLDDDLTVILAANRGDRMLDQLAIEIAGLYVPALRRPAGMADPDPAFTRRLRTIVSDLLHGRHDPNTFSVPMRSFLKTASGRGFWEWIASHGTLHSLTFSEREEKTDRRLVRYRAVLGESEYWFTVAVAPDGTIAQMYWW